MNESKRNYKKKIEELRVELYPTDADIKQRLADRKSAGEPKATYIKRLIREDMESNKQKAARALMKMYSEKDGPESAEYEAFKDMYVKPMLETIEENRK